jgi:hypothetical protein
MAVGQWFSYVGLSIHYQSFGPVWGQNHEPKALCFAIAKMVVEQRLETDYSVYLPVVL